MLSPGGSGVSSFEQLTRDNITAAQSLLEKIIPAARTGGRMGHLIEALILYNLCLERQQHEDAAGAALEEAIRLGDAEGYIQVFIDGGEVIIEQLQQHLRDFAAARDWDQFHSPKNLSMALIAEAAELVEHFQWLTESASQSLAPGKLAEVRLELADILIYLIRIGDKLGVDLIVAANDKIALNETRYPAEKVRGDARRAEEYVREDD